MRPRNIGRVAGEGPARIFKFGRDRHRHEPERLERDPRPVGYLEKSRPDENAKQKAKAKVRAEVLMAEVLAGAKVRNDSDLVAV